MPRRLGTALLAAAALAAALPAGAGAGAANPWLKQRMAVFAHQGGEDELPSNTMYALRTSLARGADWLELDVGATKDGRLVVLHDNKVDRTTNGTGSVNDLTLVQVQRLDNAYWFVPGRNAVHGLPASRYPFRGVRTGARRAPRGFGRNDFRVATLDEVLRAFPRTPINVEIKGRDGSDQAVYRRNAELLAALLRRTGRTDVIVTSFEQSAVDRFHALAPRVPLAPGISGTADFILGGGSPGPGVVAFQVPITFRFGGQLLTITTPDFVRRAHEAGYAVHVWLSNDREDLATYRSLLSMCVDGIMAATPLKLERLLRANRIARPGDRTGTDACGTRISGVTRVSGGAVTVSLARKGRSQERRAGTVTLRSRGAGGLHRGTVLGRATYRLATDQAATTARVVLSAAARAALARDGGLPVSADVFERSPASSTLLTLR